MTTRTVTGTWLDASRSPHTGSVEFSPSVYVTDTVDDQIVTTKGVTVTLDENGSISVDLNTTDDTDISTSGWSWYITERLSGLPNRTWSFELPDGVGALDLADV